MGIFRPTIDISHLGLRTEVTVSVAKKSREKLLRELDENSL